MAQDNGALGDLLEELLEEVKNTSLKDAIEIALADSK